MSTPTKSLTPNKTAYNIHGKHNLTIIFIHGVGMQANVWQPQIRYFNRYYRVITYDFLGHGISSLPLKEPTLNDYVAQLLELAQHLKLSSFALIGHSMGALIAMKFAIKYGSMVKSLVAINTIFKRNKKAQLKVLQRANMILENNKITNVEQTLKRWFANKKTTEELIKIAKIRKWLTELTPEGYGSAYKIFASADEVFKGKLHKLSMPVLYLTGENDLNSTPTMSRQMASQTPNGISICVAGEAHMMAYIAANKVNIIIKKFLTHTL